MDSRFSTEYPKYTNDRKSKYWKKDYTKDEPIQNVLPLKEFDPNQDSYEELVSKGLNDRVARSIVSYRDKGGSYRSKESLQKIYSIDDAYYEKISPFITITAMDSVYKKESVKREIVKLSVNSLSEEELKKMRGLMPYYASRIIKYRNILGGYTSIDQLGEVYGMNDEAYADISIKLFVDSALVKKINVNTISYEDLRKHPYISNNIARGIVNYREQHGLFLTMEDFKKLRILKTVDVSKILPYISLN